MVIKTSKTILKPVKISWLEVFWQDFAAKALVLVNPTVVDALAERLSTESSPYMVCSLKSTGNNFAVSYTGTAQKLYR